ncbi:MAG: hypothetical protein B5M56_03320 [Desulfococcus sp. 4484_241]|nr:MAG: hypothetical protein B5M56_03320 [Desulfococcus sp. 4484_241]
MRRAFKGNPVVGLICSPGGHLTEMQLLKDAYQDMTHFFITHRAENTSGLPGVSFLPKYSSDHSLLQHVQWFLQSIVSAYRILRNRKPTLLISTGGGDLAIPVFIVGKLLRIKLLYIEHIGRFNSPSSTGKILYLLSDRFFVQSRELLNSYGKKAEYHGAVI